MILDADGRPIDDNDHLEAQVLADLTAELLALEAVAEPMHVALHPVTAFQYAGLLQLALRHPQLQAANREAACRFLDAARKYFVGCPTILALLDRGDDPTQDVPP